MSSRRNFGSSRALGMLIAAGVLGAVIVGMVFFTDRSRQLLLRDAFERLSASSSYHAQAELSLNLPPQLHGKERPFTAVQIEVDGDVVAQEAPEFTGTMYTEARGRGNIFFADGELRLLSDAVAFRLENLPALLNPTGSLVKQWTYVNVPVLAARNTLDVRTALSDAFAGAEYVGKENRDGRSLHHFVVSLSPEQEDQLFQVLRFSASGSRAFNVLARLLGTPTTRSVDAWVDQDSGMLSLLEASFVIPLEDADPYDLGMLRISLSDYGKDVAVERPPVELTARPEVFARIFGRGEITGPVASAE